MATWKNPFKFTTTRPTLMDLWSKISTTYLTSIDQYTPEEVQLYTFMYAAIMEWDETKQMVLSEASMKKMLRNSPNVDKQLFGDLLTFKPSSYSLPAILVYTILASPSAIPIFESDLFSSQEGIETLLKEARRDKGTACWYLKNKDEVFSNIPKYLSINKVEGNYLPIKYKRDLENTIIGMLIRGDTNCVEFSLKDTHDTPR